MAHSKNKVFNKFWQGYSERSTRRTKAIAYELGLDPQNFSGIKRGKEKLKFEEGQTVVALGNGHIKKGVEMVIKQTMMRNGYAWYYAGGVWHRNNELKLK